MKNSLGLLPKHPTKTLNIIQTCSHLFKSCSITEGRLLHCLLIKKGLSSQKYVAVKLLNMYLNQKKSSDADQILKDFNGFDLVAHNCLISASIQSGRLDEARHLFDKMPDRNEVTWTTMISGLMKCGRVEESMWYFEQNRINNLFSYTAAISGLVQNGLNVDALLLFKRMLRCEVVPNAVTYTSVISACVGMGDYQLGMGLIGLIVKSGLEDNLSVCNSLITLCLKASEMDLARRIFDGMKEKDAYTLTAILDVYVEMGDLREARNVFDEMPQRGEVSWSAMIARYNQSGDAEEALKLFKQMGCEGCSPTPACLVSVISALASLRILEVGRNIHAHVVKTGLEIDTYVLSSLIDLYCKCGKTEDGRSAFESIPVKNVVTWNSMVSGYSLNGQLTEAKELFKVMPEKNQVTWNGLIAGCSENKLFTEVFELFHEMLLSGEIPNVTTFTSLLSASASAVSLEMGKILHGRIIKHRLQQDTIVGTALLDMYAKSGDFESSKLVFNRIPEKNEISWTVMIQGLAENGFAKESIALFDEIERKQSVAPNDLMLLVVLFACSHCGLIDKGFQYFNSMEELYGIKPDPRHYTCMVDMLARAGRLSEAENFIKTMPFPPGPDAWAALLGGCNTHKNKDIAERAADMLLKYTDENPADYVSMSNAYAMAGRWGDVSNVRKLMEEKQLKKNRGCSWIEIKNQFHSFPSDYGAHVQSAKIFDTLSLLRFEMLAL